MAIFSWYSRRAAGLGTIALLLLANYIIYQRSNLRRHGNEIKHPQSQSSPHSESTYGFEEFGVYSFFLAVFAFYSVFVHLNVALVPLRAILALSQITKAIKESSRDKHLLAYLKLAENRRGSNGSIASFETLDSDNSGGTSTTCVMSDTGLEDFTNGDGLIETPVIHAIVIPNYKEEIATLRETLAVLASHLRARSAYDVYLGMEQREDGHESKALSLVQQFIKNFRSIDFAVHPSHIPGEAAGKGSNMAWVARKLSAKYSTSIRKNVIITGIDADSHLSVSYFNIVANMHLKYPDTARTSMYAAPIIFDRNAHNVAGLVRVADVAWCAAGMSGLYRGSCIAPPTSVYSLPLDLVDRVGGWDSDAEAIGEDLHMYIKCFFALNGRLTCRIVPSPVSQSNVSGNGRRGLPGQLSDLVARYKQAIRHMWGALDTGFALRMALEMWRERRHTTRVFQPLHLTQVKDYFFHVAETHSDERNSDVSRKSGIFADVTRNTLLGPHWLNTLYLGHRLYEAHFLPVHMTILVLATLSLEWLTKGVKLPGYLGWALYLCNILRPLGFFGALTLQLAYEFYHRAAVNIREKEMAGAGLAESMVFSHRSFLIHVFDYALIPIVAPLYGAIPLVQATITHLWRRELAYTVSKKDTKLRSRSRTASDLA